MVQNNDPWQVLAKTLNMLFPLLVSSLGISNRNCVSYNERVKTLTNVIKYCEHTERHNDKEPLANYGKTLQINLQCSILLLWLPCRYDESLILSVFTAAYCSPPCIVPLWCWKITWCHSYRITVLDQDLQHDSKQAHFNAEVCASLNALLPGKWIANVGPIIWPPRSPDVQTLDFNFWGFVKDVMHVPPLLNNLHEMHQFISEAVNKVDKDILWTVWVELDYRWDSCRAVKGLHTEDL